MAGGCRESFVPPTATLKFGWAASSRDCIDQYPDQRARPHDFADRLFRARSGVSSVAASQRRRARSPGADSATKQQTLAEHRSRPLSEVLRDINKRSDNPITRLTFLALADRVAPERTQCGCGQRRVTVRQWLRGTNVSATPA